MDITAIGEHAFMERWRLELLAASDAQEEQVAETADWLGISKSAYYRRRRGEMPFSAFEYVALSQKFGLDMAPAETPQFDFEVPLSADSAFNEKSYLQQIEAAAFIFPDARKVEVLVSTTDIPIFYLFAEPDLAAFKRYLFGLAIDASSARKFKLSRARQEHAEFVLRASSISRTYLQTSREEAWGPAPLRSLLYQLLLLVESAAISQEDCDKLFVGIERVIDRLEANLSGADEGSGRLKLWQNRLHTTSSIICMRSGTTGRLFVTFDNPNFFHSENPAAVTYFESHFEALRRRSLRVAGHGVLSPSRYARELRDQVARGRQSAARVFGSIGEEL